MIWRIIARVLDLGLLTVRPSWSEIKYKIRGRIMAARQRREWAAQQRTVEYGQFQTWRALWCASHAEQNRKRDKKRAIQARLNVMLSRP